MQTRLFVVHGMGVNAADWADSIVSQLSTLYSHYPKLAALDENERYTVHPIRYDDVLSELVTAWQTNASAISKLSRDVGAPLSDALVGWLRTAGTGFQWTHAADVLLYRCFSDVREAIIVTVARQILDVLLRDLEEVRDVRWGVLAHSLGTAVTHDALHALWTTSFDGVRFSPESNKAAFVCMLANVSRVLESDVDVLKSTVQPGPRDSVGRGCVNYLTVRHFLDPFTIPRAFDPSAWPDAETVQKGLYQSIHVKHIRDRNVHGFSHYLMHPAVHIPMLRLLANQRSVITPTEERRALSQFTDFGDLSVAAATREVKRLELMQPARSATWESLRGVWDAYHGA